MAYKISEDLRAGSCEMECINIQHTGKKPNF